MRNATDPAVGKSAGLADPGLAAPFGEELPPFLSENVQLLVVEPARC